MNLVVVSDADPVARRVAERWGALPASGDHVDGAVVRIAGDTTRVVRRPGLHIRDELLDARLPPSISSQGPTLIFPSIHRSEQNVACLTVHPLGNLGDQAEVGGRPRTVVPTDARGMTALLRRLAEASPAAGLPVTFEATHHGPELGLPAFFAEIGFGAASGPAEEAVRVLADALLEIVPDGRDRVVVGIGGGHYAPHFTELALHRRWAFGHLISRHALHGLDGPTAEAVYRATWGAEGLLFARSQDATRPELARLGKRWRDQDAPARSEEEGGRTTPAARSSGT